MNDKKSLEISCSGIMARDNKVRNFRKLITGRRHLPIRNAKYLVLKGNAMWAYLTPK